MAMLQFPSPHEKILPGNIRIVSPSTEIQDAEIFSRIVGSLVGLAVGDALGASMEFRPHEYLLKHPVKDMVGGGTWGLKAGQWTDDTSMTLCLAASLITQRGFNPYDQMVRYKWWYRHGYLSSTGHCFDIGNATRSSLEEFYRRQKELKRHFNCRTQSAVDELSFDLVKSMQFDVNCSKPGVAGNGALMRLAPVPLFFYRTPAVAVDLCGQSARLTHGDATAVDACRYYGALIIAAVTGESKEDLLSEGFCHSHQAWLGSNPLHEQIVKIAIGSFKKRRGYKDGIRGKGYVVPALEAALWAFWSTDSFDEGALAAVNLGDDTDTTAAIYGQLAGAHYGYQSIPETWRSKLYAIKLVVCIAEWLQFLGPSESEASEKENITRNIISSMGQVQQPSDEKPAEAQQPSATNTTEVQESSDVKPVEIQQPNDVKPIQVQPSDDVQTAEVQEPGDGKPAEVQQPSDVKAAQVQQPSDVEATESAQSRTKSEKAAQSTQPKRSSNMAAQSTKPNQSSKKAEKSTQPKESSDTSSQSTQPKQKSEKTVQSTEPKHNSKTASQSTQPKSTGSRESKQDSKKPRPSGQKVSND